MQKPEAGSQWQKQPAPENKGRHPIHPSSAESNRFQEALCGGGKKGPLPETDLHTPEPQYWYFYSYCLWKLVCCLHRQDTAFRPIQSVETLKLWAFFQPIGQKKVFHPRNGPILRMEREKSAFHPRIGPKTWMERDSPIKSANDNDEGGSYFLRTSYWSMPILWRSWIKSELTATWNFLEMNWMR